MHTLQSITHFLNHLFPYTKLPVVLLNKHYLICQTLDSMPYLPINIYQEIFVDAELHQNDHLQIFFQQNEMYLLFSFQLEEIAYVCFGPQIIQLFKDDKNTPFHKIINENDVQMNDFSFNDLMSAKNFKVIQYIYSYLTNQELSTEEIRKLLFESKKSNVEDFVYENIIDKREEKIHNYPYFDEQQLLNYVKKGNSLAARLYASSMINRINLNISTESILNYKLHYISIITLMTRTVIPHGISKELAFSTQDIYTKKLINCTSFTDLTNTYHEAIIDYCKLAKKHLEFKYPYWTRQILEYIDNHLHQSISLDELAKIVYFSPAYLSVQFKKIVGISIKDYINQQKIEESKFLLTNSNASIQEIASSLNFASQSYFTLLFKRYTNTLPKIYRETSRQAF